MGRKYIIIGGQKVYLDAMSVKDEPNGEEPETPVETPAEEPEADENAVKAAGKQVAKQIMAELGYDKIQDAAKAVTDFMNFANPANSKLKELLHGKDFMKDKNQLTKEEKIVGFWYALVTRNEIALKALSEGTAADGGYLFPDEMFQELVKDGPDLTFMRTICRVIPMRRDIMDISTLVSGVKVAWTAENAVKGTTSAHFGQVLLTARKAAAILYSSDELIEDSTEIDLVTEIIDMFRNEITNEEERCFIAGNGTTEPRGLTTSLTASEIGSITAGGNLSFARLIDLEHLLPKKHRANAAYLMHGENVKELRKLTDTTGRFIWQPAVVAGAPDMLNGHPLYESDWCPVGTIFFGDFKKGYWIGDRKRMTVKISQETETAFTKDQTAIRVVIRVAGNVVWPRAIKALTSIP